MKRKIHPMLSEETQFEIAFIYQGQEGDFKDFKGKEVIYYCGQNPLSNDWMYWWSHSDKMWTAEKSLIKSVVRGIRKKEKVIFDNFNWVH